MDFKDKVALVTGASSGIGEATALELARRGADVALVGRDEGALASVAERCSALGPQALAIVADLATDDGCERVVKETLQRFGRLDVLINNAGITARTLLSGADMATFDRVFATNVRAVYQLTRLLVPALEQARGCVVNVSSIAGSAVYLGCLPYSMSKVGWTGDMATFDRVFATNARAVYQLTRLLVPALEQARGCVVNVSSIAGSAVYLGCLPYSMSKAALDHFTSLTALELAPKGVRVNAVSPGLTVSKIVQRATGYTDAEYAAWLKESEKAIPTGHACSADEIARTIAWVASPGNQNLTGANIPVDGALRFVSGSSQFLVKQVNK